MPMFRLPRPSNARSEIPLKSLIRGRATLNSLSRKSYIRSPRRVTLAPMATPARSLKLAIDFFARVTSGRCPVIRVSSSTALSICRGSATASPPRHLHHVPVGEPGAQPGDDLLLIPFLQPRGHDDGSFDPDLTLPHCAARPGPHLLSTLLAAVAADSHLGPVGQVVVPEAHRLPALGADQHHLARRDLGLFLHDPTLRQLRRRLGGPLHHVYALDDDAAVLGEDLQHLAALAAVLPGDHLHGVALLHVHRLPPHCHGHRSQHLRRQRDDLHVLALPQLPGHGTEDPRPPRVLAVGGQQHGGVVIEADVGAVRPAHLLARAHYHRLDDLPLLHGAVGDGLFDGPHDDGAHGGVAAPAAAEYADDQDLPRPGVVGHLQPGLLLDHAPDSASPSGTVAGMGRCSSTRTMRHHFSLLSGRVSVISTTSPTRLAFSSSCALNFLLWRTVFL